MAEYRMPSLGSDMRDGRVVEWYVEPGATVRRGDVVGVVDTDKGAIEMEIWEDAVIEEIVVPPGEKVPVGEVLLRLGPAAPSGARPAAAPAWASRAEAPVLPSRAETPMTRARPAAPAQPEAATPVQAPAPAAPPPPEPSRVRASPAARTLARELGVDLSQVAGSGPGGAVVRADVETGTVAVHATPLARRVAEVEGVDLSTVRGTGPGGVVTRGDVEAAGGAAPLDAMRRAIAAAMARSKREIPHYYLSASASMLRATEWLAAENARRAPEKRLLPVSLLLKAVALAAREFPELNGHWSEQGYRPADAVHPGLAISLRGGGLVAPAIHDADRRTLEELTAAVMDLVQRARAGRLRSSEVTDATLTVTSLGDRGVDVVYGVIYPPQVAIVGFGRIAERPWAEAGMLGVRPTVEITLSADHRASDGHRGGLFLERVVALLQHPEDL